MKKLLLLFLLLSFLTVTAQLRTDNHLFRINDSITVDLYNKKYTPFNLDSSHQVYLIFRNTKRNDSVIVKTSGLFFRNCRYFSKPYFLNRNTGFISMSGGCYESFSFIFRTTNGGRKWKTVFGSYYDYRISTANMHFRNKRKGICIEEFRNNEFRYLVTTNGGKRWKKKSSGTLNLIGYYKMTDIAYPSSGGVEITLTELLPPDSAATAKTIIYRSEDYGKKFVQKN